MQEPGGVRPEGPPGEAAATPGAEPAGASRARGRRPPSVSLALATALVLGGTGLAAVTASSGAGRSAGATRPASPAAVTSAGAVSAEAVRSLLGQRAAAVLSGRLTDWNGLLDPGVPGLLAAQRTLYDRLRLLPFTVFGYELMGSPGGAEAGAAPAGGASREPGRVIGPDGVVVQARLHYRLPGDTRDVLQDQVVTLTRRAGRWLLSGADPSRTDPAPWDLGQLTVQRGRRAVVIGIGRPPAADPALRRTAAEADRAGDGVDRVWGTSGPRSAVVVLPETRQEMAAVLGRPDGAGLDQVAAVTSGELTRDAGPATAGAADRVVLNPGAFVRLTDTGRQVVLTHELTHVVTRATARVGPPLWVEEGFANYVAYRDAGLPAAVIASDVIPFVRAGKAPEHLPTAAEFDPVDTPIAAAYADAWLAFQLMSAAGPERPVMFYRTAAGLAGGAATSGAALQLAFRQVLGMTEPAFEVQWRAYRRSVADQAGRS